MLGVEAVKFGGRIPTADEFGYAADRTTYEPAVSPWAVQAIDGLPFVNVSCPLTGTPLSNLVGALLHANQKPGSVLI